jgi:DNA (cytosine-5)-methyltransferase 1
MTAYYNEISAHKAETTRILCGWDEIAPGFVDERSIEEVQPEDIADYTQHHFFAGAGGWSLALRNAEWPDDLPVWSGSCPCQSFSISGSQRGKSDPRHLWPQWFRLIKSCKPPIIFGEQVESAIRHGWLDEVSNDLGAQGYTTEAFILPSQIVAEHKRDRIYFVAVANPSSGNLKNRLIQSRRANGRLSKYNDSSRSNFSWSQSQTNRELDKTELVNCRDGKVRKIECGILPLTDGLSSRMVPSGDLSVKDVENNEEARLDRIHIYGDAIQIRLASIFIRSVMEVLLEL